jgi:hypothetical protein
LWTKIFHIENLSPDDVRYMCKNLYPGFLKELTNQPYFLARKG